MPYDLENTYSDSAAEARDDFQFHLDAARNNAAFAAPLLAQLSRDWDEYEARVSEHIEYELDEWDITDDRLVSEWKATALPYAEEHLPARKRPLAQEAA